MGAGARIKLLVGPFGWLIVAVLPTAESDVDRRPERRTPGVNSCPWCGGQFRAD